TLKKGWIASSSTTLVRDGKINIIVDPGINRRKLLSALKREGLKPEDIDYVFMTHFHPDHNYLVGIFPKAKALDDELVYDDDKEYEHGGKIPGTNLKILSTPGHEKSHGSLIVPTEKGTVIVAGDVWWWKTSHKQKTDRESLLNLKDMYVKDKKALLESRKKILEIADWIIPGHGKMFKNPTRT
ncbi:MAG TPA: MBL fold metallo-hydrolase, partial [Nitrospinota bacterium]|nr:MBL fold metallo-hydrolase [Nitrospinota bacterium]